MLHNPKQSKNYCCNIAQNRQVKNLHSKAKDNIPIVFKISFPPHIFTGVPLQEEVSISNSRDIAKKPQTAKNSISQHFKPETKPITKQKQKPHSQPHHLQIVCNSPQPVFCNTNKTSHNNQQRDTKKNLS